MDKLKKLRIENKLTQEEVARIFKINTQYYSMIERGVRTPGFRLAKVIADYYGCTVDDIFFAKEKNNMFHGKISHKPTA